MSIGDIPSVSVHPPLPLSRIMAESTERDTPRTRPQQNTDEPHELEEIVLKKKRQIASVQQSLNGLQPIACLMHDILLIIFTYCINEMPLYERRPFDNVALTHICSHWRDVVIHSPTLWNEVNLLWPPWTSVFIERSCPAPLRITMVDQSMHARRSSAPPIAALVFKLHSRRIEYLEMRLLQNQHPWLQNFLFPETLPALRGLTFIAYCCTGCQHFAPLTFFKTLPEIREMNIGYLLLTHCLSTSYPKLHSLQLTGSGKMRLPMRDVIRFLNNMPQLKRLILYDVFDKQSLSICSLSAALPISCTIPSLSYLSIQQDTPRCTAFLERLQVPSLTTIEIVLCAGNEMYSAKDTHALAQCLASIMEQFPPLTRIVMEPSRSPKLLAGQSDTVGSPMDPIKSRSAPGQSRELGPPLRICSEMNNRSNFGWFLSHSKLMSQVQELDLSITETGRYLPHSSFPNLLQITTLRLWDWSIIAIRNILAAHDLPSHAKHSQPLPNLRKLGLMRQQAIGHGNEKQLVADIQKAFANRTIPSTESFELSLDVFDRRPHGFLTPPILTELIEGIFTSYDNAYRLGTHTTPSTSDAPAAQQDVCVQNTVEVQSIPRREFAWKDEWTKCLGESSITFKFWSE